MRQVFRACYSVTKYSCSRM